MTTTDTASGLRPGQCINWWQVVTDLQMFMSVAALSEVVVIPKSTIMGYKNGGAEPKHADGERLLSLWRQRFNGDPPVVMCAIRQTDRVQK